MTAPLFDYNVSKKAFKVIILLSNDFSNTSFISKKSLDGKIAFHNSY